MGISIVGVVSGVLIPASTSAAGAASTSASGIVTATGPAAQNPLTTGESVAPAPAVPWRTSADSTGIVPPTNPAANVSASTVCPYRGSTTTCLGDINKARSALESIGPVALPSNWATLTSSKQLFVFANLERTSRGEPAIPYLITSYNAQVETAVLHDADPNPGTIRHSWGSIWAGGSTITVLESFDLWMYYDGPGGDNIDCTGTSTSGCWGHREIVLSNASFVGDPTEMDAIAGTDTSGVASIAALFVTNSTAPPGQTVLFTWSEEQPYLTAPRITTTVTVTSSVNPSTFGESVTFTATVSPADGGGSVSFTLGQIGADITGCASVALTQVSGSAYAATCQSAVLPEGDDTISVGYSGDAAYAPSSGALSGSQTVTASPLPDLLSISPKTGSSAGGSTVVIVGERFTGATTVNFGTSPGTFRVTGPTRITATSPPGSGTVLISVTTTKGVSPSTAAGRFTYVDSTPTATALDYQPLSTSGAAWVPVDGRADYCRLLGAGPNWIASHLACTPYNGVGFGTTVTSGVVDWGYPRDRAWIPTASGADYCRLVGPGPNLVASALACTSFNGASFGPTVVSGLTDWGYVTGSQWVDAGGSADYCRLVGPGPNFVASALACTPFNGTGFGRTAVSGLVDWGYPRDRAWIPTAGGADYCRLVGPGPNFVASALACTPFNGTSFGPTAGSGLVDWGYETGAQWVATSSGADYCRRVGAGPDWVASYLACTPFDGSGFGPTVTSGLVDWGYSTGVQWVPSGGRPDYCRRVGAGPDWVASYLACTPFNGSGFGPTVTSALVDWGYATRWGWLPAGVGVVDYCRRVGDGPDGVASFLGCNSLIGTRFKAEVASGVQSWGR